MNKNIFKKIIASISLVIFILGIFLPFKIVSAYPMLTIKSDTLTLKSGSYIYISADISELKNKLISFTSSPSEGVTFTDSDSCNTGNSFSCSVQFSSTKKGKYTINASTIYNGVIKAEKPIIITVTGETVAPTCTPPKGIDPTTNKCVDCQAPKTIVDGFCKIKDTPPTPINNPPTQPVSTNTTYMPLAPLPGLGLDENGQPTNIPIQTDPGCKFDEKGNVVPGSCTNPCPFGNYLNIMIKLIIGIAAVLAMVMIVMGGIEYMTSELISGKEEGKETITHAILGLMIALGAYLILNTINPQLLSACLDKLPEATITIDPEIEASLVAGGDANVTQGSGTQVSPSSLASMGFKCPKNGGQQKIKEIAQSFFDNKDKVFYSQQPRNTIIQGKLYLDCSSFVKLVYNCAGLDFKGYSTINIFPGTEGVNSKNVENTQINGKELRIGDLLGYMLPDKISTEKHPGGLPGHIFMYFGNSQTIEVHAGNPPTISVRSLSKWKNVIRHIIRIN